MAHDVGFYDVKEIDQEDGDHKVIGYFFGYAGGIFYSAFNATICDNGMSGSNQGVLRTSEQMRAGIARIKASSWFTDYPDPKRIPEIIAKLEAFLDEHPDRSILIHYS